MLLLEIDEFRKGTNMATRERIFALLDEDEDASEEQTRDCLFFDPIYLSDKHQVKLSIPKKTRLLIEAIFGEDKVRKDGSLKACPKSNDTKICINWHHCYRSLALE